MKVIQNIVISISLAINIFFSYGQLQMIFQKEPAALAFFIISLIYLFFTLYGLYKNNKIINVITFIVGIIIIVGLIIAVSALVYFAKTFGQ